MLNMRLSLTSPVTGGELDAIETKLANLLKKSGVRSYEVTTTPFEADGEKEFGIYPKYWGVYQIRCGEVSSTVSASIREFCCENGLTW